MRNNGLIPGVPPKSWQGYVEVPSEDVQELQSIIGVPEFWGPAFRAVANRNSMPPIYLYLETKDSIGNYEISYIYGGGGNSTAVKGMSIQRDLIYQSPRSVSANTRGEILDAFCEIEFLIDILTCVGKGVYEKKTSYRKVKRLYSWDSTNADKLPDTQNRLDFIHNENLISDKTYELLTQAKKVRNTLAHQFIPELEDCVSVEVLKEYKDAGDAIFSIYNTSWFLLLKDYVRSQNRILKWLRSFPEEFGK